MNAKTYRCPKCGIPLRSSPKGPLGGVREVTTNDPHVEKDIMLCPSCGEVSCFSEVINMKKVGGESRWTEELAISRDEDEARRLLEAAPPKHLKVVADTTEGTGRIVCTYRKMSPMAIFLVPFTAVCADVSLKGIYGSQIMKHHFDLQASLGGLPFLVGSIALISTCLFMLFGKRELTLERGRGKFFFGVGPIGFWRRFTYDRQTRIVFGETSPAFGWYGTPGPPLPELQLTRPGNPQTVHICAGMSEDALDYIAALLKREAGRV